MLTIGISGSVMVMRQSLTNTNVLGGLMSFIGFKALASPGGTLNGVPFFMPFFLAMLIALAAAGVVRLIRRGALWPAPRLQRHLWRMCFALFIAAGSFFSIRERVAKILPNPLTTPAMRIIPVILVFVAMFYWLWRVRTWRIFHKKLI